MSSRLDLILDWKREAELSHYSVNALADRCHTTPRHLERYFLIKKGRSPHSWLLELKMETGKELLLLGLLPKVVARELYYEHPNNFSRDFKRYFGVLPSAFVGLKEENVAF